MVLVLLATIRVGWEGTCLFARTGFSFLENVVRFDKVGRGRERQNSDARPNCSRHVFYQNILVGFDERQRD